MVIRRGCTPIKWNSPIHATTHAYPQLHVSQLEAMAERQSLDELTKSVPQRKLNQPCADEHLLEIALSISNWRSIAPFLGLDEVFVDSIEIKNPKDLLAQTIAILRKWREQCGRKATYRKLTKVFWKLQRSDLVAKLTELLTSEFESSNSGSEEEGDAQLDSCSMYLKDLYLSRLPVATVSFLPIPKSKYTKLAMIVTEESNFPDEELVALKHRGKVKEIQEKKIPVELKDVFTSCKETRKVVLVEGVAGAGKSSMVINACREWGMGNIFKEFKRVVLVELRDPNIQAAKTLADILPAEIAKDMEALIRAVGGEATLIVFDGWDEFPAHLRQESLVQRIIDNPGSLSLHKSAVMITSRPECSADLHHLASSRIEILGFSEDAVKEYFTESLGGNSKKVGKLTSYFEEHPHIADSCYVPLNAAVILHLFLSFIQALPSTLHGVFCALVLCCIIREVKKNDPKRILPHLSTFDDIPSDLLQQLKNLCSLAYYGTRNGKILFSTQDLTDCGIDVNRLCATFGLLQTSESFVACQKQYTCNFLHLSVQELLTAFHISQLPVEGTSDDSQVRVVKFLLEENHTQVLIFYSGFTHLIHEEMNALFRFDILFLRCVFEAQNPKCYKHVSIPFEGIALGFSSLQDCLAFDYFLKRGIVLNTKFTLRVHGDQCLPILSRNLNCAPANSVSLQLYGLIAESSFVCISDMLKSSLAVFEVAIRSCKLSVRGWQCIALALQDNTSLSKLRFMHTCMFTKADSCDVRIAFTKALHQNTTLRTLHLSFCLNFDIANLLSEGLYRNCGLKELVLNGCNITCCGVTMLAKALEHHCTLDELGIASNLIGDDGATAIAGMLSVNDNLLTLDISKCCISDVGLEAIAIALVVNTTLRELCISYNLITDNGLIMLGQKLKNTTLETLHMMHLEHSPISKFLEYLHNNCLID